MTLSEPPRKSPEGPTPARSPAARGDGSTGALESKFLLAALAAHGVFLFVAWLTPAPKYDVDEDKPLDVVEIELPKDPEKEDVREENVDRVVEPGAVAERPRDPSRPDTPDARPSRGSTAAPDATGDPAAEPPVAAGPAPPANEYEDAPPGANTWSMPGAPGGMKVYALRGGMPDVAAAPAAPTEAPRAQKVDRNKANEILSADIRDKDKKLGLNLPAAGTVASFVKNAVWGSDVPTESRATIQIALDANGKVTSVRVTGQSAGAAGTWDAVAASVKASLSGQTLKMSGDFSKGAIITVNVQSKMQMPSGNKQGDPVSLNLGKSGPGGSFDLADIGAKPIRQVLTPFSVQPIK
jgi:hypothetical protein